MSPSTRRTQAKRNRSIASFVQSTASSLQSNGSRRKKIRYAVVGLGYISQIAVLPSFAHARENSELTALVSGDAQKLTQLSKKYKVAATYSYDQFSDCLRSGEIDAVYIATPNHLHRDQTVQAAQAGIHVLCEKPMALTEAECQAMIAATAKSHVKLMIAYRLHFELGNLRAIETITSGKIGDPRIFTSVFSQQVKAGNSRLKKDVGAGVLYDMGVYCINAARYLFRAEPNEVMAWNLSGEDKRFREVPEMTSAMLRFPGDRVASFTCSFGATDRAVFEVVGTKGIVKMDPAYEMAEPLVVETTIEGRKKTQRFSKRDQFAPELVYFSDCVLHDKQPEPSGQEGLADVRIVEAILHSAGTRRAIDIAPVKIAERPAMDMEISKPPVSKPPELVKAASPGAE